MSLHFGRYMSGNGLSKLAPPEWLCEHPEIRNRGIQLEIPLKPVSLSSVTLLRVLTTVSLVLCMAHELRVTSIVRREVGSSRERGSRHLRRTSSTRSCVSQPHLAMRCHSFRPRATLPNHAMSREDMGRSRTLAMGSSAFARLLPPST